MATENELIECLHETTPFCTDVIKMIASYTIPIKFQENKIYVGHTRFENKIQELFFVSKINKKSIRNEGQNGALMNRIPIEDFISFKLNDCHKPPCFNLKYYEKSFDGRRYIANKDECITDYLVYHDDKYLYFGYNSKNSFATYKLKKDDTEQYYICNKLTRYEDKIYPHDTFDTSKYTFLNIPPHLEKYF